MECVIKTLLHYMQDNGLAEKGVSKGLKEKFENAVNLNQEDHPVSERNLLLVLEEYINKSSRLKEENQNFTKMLYERFIFLDDNSILKAVRKLFLAHQQSRRKIKKRFFNLWSKNTLYTRVPQSSYSVKQEKLIITNDEKEDAKSKIFKPNCEMNESPNKNIKTETNTIKSEIDDLGRRPSSRKEIPRPKKLDINIFDRLHKEKESRELKIQSIQNKFRDKEVAECTFTPKIKKIKMIKSLNNSPKVPVHEKLYNVKKQKEEKIKYLSLETEHKQNLECPFKPKLYNNKDKGRSDKLNLSFKERIKYYKENKTKNIRKLQDMYQYTFVPTEPSKTMTNCNSEAKITNSSEKLKIYHKEKQEKIRRIENEMLVENGLTFKPRLNENSLNAVGENVIKRNEDFVKNRDLKIKSYVKRDDIECTFTPKIITQHHPLAEADQLTVQERLYSYDKIYKEKKETYKEGLVETFPFKPEINKNTEDILRRKQEILEEIKQKFDRKRELEHNDEIEQGNENEEKINEDYLNDQKKRIRWKNEINLLTEGNIEEEKNESERRDSKRVQYSSRNEGETPILEEEESNREDEMKKSREKHKEGIINLENKKLRESTQGNNKPQDSPYKHTFNVNKGGYELLDKNYYSKMTDQQLLSLANNIVSPDASLEKFQMKFKNDRYKEEMVRTCQEDMKRDFKLKKSIETVRKSKEVNSNYINTDSSVRSNKALPKNIKQAIEYYNQLNN